MKFVNKETGLGLIISQKLVEEIAKNGINKYPNEFGGLLLGRYINKNKIVVIEESILPKKYISSRYYFERGSEVIKEILVTKYNANPSLKYVGEWHTHPDGPARPSPTDLNAMRELANDSNVFITNPVLMIMEIWKTRYKMELYFFSNNRLLRYDMVEEKEEVTIGKGINNLLDDNNEN